MIYIVIGVCGVGKTTIGQALGQRLDIPFFDADDFHPASNLQKLETGIALNDDDRAPWLEELAHQIIKWNKNGGAVLACSALKEKYRKTLQSIDSNEITFVFLNADHALILERLSAREGHFMNPDLLDSQFEVLEKPTYGIHINARLSPDEIIEEIMGQIARKSTFGIIGLGVMGKSLARNLAGKNIKLSAFNRHVANKEVDIAKNFVSDHQELNMSGFDDLNAFVQSLQRPRNILLMVNAGAAVDMVIKQLLPLLDKDDLIIDGGNSHFKDTKRRLDDLENSKIQFIGMGVSGGEEGALKGPSIMPGGTREGYARIAPILESIAAKDKNGQACCAYAGPEGAGHFVKMIHNGIEYAEMQLIAEVYYLLRFHGNMLPDQIADLFSKWQADDLGSYLLEISIDILRAKEGDKYMIDLILDKAGQKGTGGWSTVAALDLGKPLNTISDAVMARCLSAMKDTRVKASEIYQKSDLTIENLDVDKLKDAYQAARLINHAIGFDVIKEASTEYQWDINFSEIARIWTNGCIIRSQLMEQIVEQTKESADHLLLHPTIAAQANRSKLGYAEVVGEALKAGASIPVLSSALNYFLGFISAQSSANMIQAQRDYFGAHTFQRVDRELGAFFHHKW